MGFVAFRKLDGNAKVDELPLTLGNYDGFGGIKVDPVTFLLDCKAFYILVQVLDGNGQRSFFFSGIAHS